MLDRLGLADRLHQLPHRKLRIATIVTPAGCTTLADFSRLRTRFPYIMVMPQAAFLDFLAAEAGKAPAFRLMLGANVQRLIEENGAVRGVRYQTADGASHDLRAMLTVGADGRFSRLRKLAGFEPVRTAPPMDVLWFRLPRRPEDEKVDMTGTLNVGGGHFAIMLERPTGEWQVGYVILKGSFADVKAAGIESLRRGLAELVPALADRVGELRDFHQVTVLSVESSRVKCWHKPGLLLIGDAAHVMSPVGGIGIQYAVQDAVETANQLTEPLRRGVVTDEQLAAVQRRRERSVRLAQKLQGYMQENIAAQALRPDRPFRLPLAMRVLRALPFVRNLPVRALAFGAWPSTLREE
jgi:2-polyprenyl-6-methoxyphenol hydroxylase-like FAD-dependent oxidoreductase